MSYRLTIKVKSLLADQVAHLIGIGEVTQVRGFLAGLGGESPLEFILEHDDKKLRDPVEIARTLTALHAATLQALRDELERTGLVTAGPLQLGRTELMWKRNEPITRAEVEAIELFDNSPIQLRVMKHDKVWPYGKADTDDIPNVVEVLRLAHELGYPVKGLALLDALFSAVP